MTDFKQRPDVKAAMARMTTKIGTKKELRELPEMLQAGEQVLHLAAANYGGGNGLFIVTDRRVMYLMKGIMRTVSEDFPYSRINSVELKKGLINATIIINAGGSKSKIDVTILDPQIIVEDIRARLGQPALAAPSESSSANELHRLADLHAQGLLTDDEFAAAKARILGI